MPVKKHQLKAAVAAMTTGFKAIFAGVFKEVDPQWQLIAEKVNSSDAIETYAWLGQIPGMKKWIDERRIKRLTEHAYLLENDLFEDTIAVPRVAVEDDRTGTYSMRVKGLANAAATHPDELVFTALKKGFENPCYDGQNFFDTDHPVMVDGDDVSVSNMQDGSGAAWYLLCTNHPVMPLIYQERIAAELDALEDAETSDYVFMKDEYLYGVRSRGAAGYSYWQLAFASKQPLTAENYEAARTAMANLKGDEGRPLNIVPNLLVVPPSLEKAAKKIVKAEKLADGADNLNTGTAEILMTPWVA